MRASIGFCLLGMIVHDGGAELYMMITEGYKIPKHYVQGVTGHDFSRYDDMLIPTDFATHKGDFINGLWLAILVGWRGDTSYNILLAFKDNRCIDIREQPKKIIKEDSCGWQTYLLGEMTMFSDEADSTCERVYLRYYDTVRTDTFRQFYVPSQSFSYREDTLVYCSDR